MKQWQFKPQASAEFKRSLSQANYSAFILDLLYQRGLTDDKQIANFLRPDYETGLHDPLLMRGVRQAVAEIARAIKDDEKIAIFGDYDADGVCGAAVLALFLNLFDVNPEVYIPGRLKEGYGLNEKAIQLLAESGVKLIITVDCGVSDFKEIDLANQLGIKVIVVDHHFVADHLPAALAVIDPWQDECQYPFKYLAGVGVAFKLVQALLQSSFAKKNKTKIPLAFDKWLLDLVSLGTVADCMPLLDENRIIVKYGLVVLAQSQRPGLKALFKVARIEPTFDSQSLITNLDSYTLGYVLGPRLNAAGRMAHANTAYELLVCQSENEANFLAERLNQKNQERQEETARVTNQVEGCLRQKNDLPIIVFEGDSGWPIGINGLVAGRIADKYWRPTFIYNLEDEQVVGSARSIPGFNIVKALAEAKEYLQEFGGHSGAAGFSLKSENLNKLQAKLLQLVEEKIKPEDLERQLLIDLNLMPEDISWQTYREFQQLAPFGQGNQLPICCLTAVEVIGISLVGNTSKHLRLDLKAQSPAGRIFIFRTVGFNFAAWANQLKLGDKIDVVFELMADDWRGPEQVQLKLVDLRSSTAS